METHTIRNVMIKMNGKQIASLPEAVVSIDLNRIEVTIDEVMLSNYTLSLLKLGTEKVQKEIEVSGATNDRILTVKKAKVNRLSLEGKRGETVLLKNISILGRHTRWEPKK